MLWSRKDVGDMFDGCLSPLGRSFAQHYALEIHPRCVAATGLWSPGDPREYYRLERGYLYANVSYFAHLFSQTPLGRDLRTLTGALSDGSVDVAAYQNPYGAHARADATGAAWWTLLQTRTFTRTAREAAVFASPTTAPNVARVRAVLAVRPSDRRLARAIAAAKVRLRLAYVQYFPVVFNVFLLQSVLVRAAERLGGKHATALRAWARRKADARGPEREALARLTVAAARHARLSAALLGASDADLRAAVERLPGGREIAAGVRRFVLLHGASGTREMDLALPRYLDDPQLVYARIRDRLQGSPESEPQPFPRSLVADAQTRGVLAGLCAALAVHAAARNALRSKVVGAIWEVRALLVEAFTRVGSARSAVSDVGLWTLGEAEGALDRGLGPTEAALASRRHRHDEDALHVPPPTILRLPRDDRPGEGTWGTGAEVSVGPRRLPLLAG